MTARPDPITVLLAFNAKYAQHAAACMASLLQHSAARFEFRVVAGGGASAGTGRIRRSFGAHKPATIDIRQFSLPAETHRRDKRGAPEQTCRRFWVGDLLPDRS